ncbi:hypothetical protein C8R43DRAFT_998263 [Mycena crocata]|nr:hypothetical protein C8R43DRAFT_998263 [Mycena crocata]
MTELDMRQFHDTNQARSESEDNATQSPSVYTAPLSVVNNMSELETLRKASGPTVEKLRMQNYDMKKQPPANPVTLSYFPKLIHLYWASPPKFSFTKPAAGFSAFPRLQTLSITDGSSSVFELFSNLPLDALESASLHNSNFPSTEACLRRHGPKLVVLTAALDLLTQSKVFDLCPRLARLTVYAKSASRERKPISEDFFGCAAPHTALVQIQFFGLSMTDRLHRPVLKTIFAALDPARFPALKEIKFGGIMWPTSEQEARKREAVKLSGILRPKGIKLVNNDGVGWTPRS